MKKSLLSLLLSSALASTLLAQAPIKKVLLEEYTTASCGNCPPKSAIVNQWHLDHAANTILVTIHQGSGVDAMSNATTNNIFNAMHSSKGWFAPAITINRGLYPWIDSVPYLSVYKSFEDNNNKGIDSIATRLINEPAKVGVKIAGTFDAAKRTITANVSATFVEGVGSGDWRLNLFLIEDSVIGYPGLGPFKGWDQHCYDANWANANYPGKYDGTSIIGFPHRHVMRDAMLGDWGVKGLIPATPVVGVEYQKSIVWSIDTAYKLNNLKLVAFVSSYGSSKSQKYILNAEEVEVTPSFVSGISSEDFAVSNKMLSIFPVPSSDLTNIIYNQTAYGSSIITITNILGETIATYSSNDKQPGNKQMVVDVSNFAKGLYIVTLNTPNGKHTDKFLVH